MAKWPDWWAWELEFSPHVRKRMIDRKFNEAELRGMIEEASDYCKDYNEDRWVLTTWFDGCAWEVIVEPDRDDEVVVVITAYPVY